MIVLDTNVVSELFRASPDSRVISWLSTVADDVAITSITLAELLAGVRALPDGRRKAALQVAIHEAMLPYRQTDAVLPFDDRAAEQYAEVLELRRQAGLPTSTADAQIAAICRAKGAVCATRNTKDFVEAGVELLNPWE
ncbi:type II toxin-antitoxin system VapC family toxin [Microbacterium oryzae]|uniref:type II toxin-antitoxin system VapC family toxin n=1 Tax=Microbacterium oryzae TaxID=743009 RepID=UPI0025B1B40B|nr:type II toxin-antitoxin system VapC family toxin [Microbacterium oryzae]MDN3311015.1 type II toxin-antitoxin system VapC family toxin [Microbacterium oryzae]